MKRKKLLAGLFSVLGIAAMSNSFAQLNLGASCGCPVVGSRSTELITNAISSDGSAVTWVTLPASAYGKELTSGKIVLTCDKIWTLDAKLYVGPNASIYIEPGTLIKANPAPSVAEARALIIERGGKIYAPGTEDCPIVFTNTADPMDGTYSVTNKGMWGGILICGKATNNLKIATNGPFIPGQGGKMAIADGLGVLEGFASSYPQDQFGVAQSVPTGASTSTSPSGSYTFGLLATSVTPASGCNGVGNTKIELFANAPAYVVQGQTVSGAGIPNGTTILSISSKQLTLSAALTAAIASSAEITFNGTYPNAGQTGYFSTMNYVAPSSGSAPVSGTTGTVASYVGAYYTSTAAFNDNDNSGVMTYVSIRHSGANLLVGSEINGLTLASVGSGTKIEHIEIVSCADDNIEIFGGTVDLKYCTTIFGNDDMFDYDLGWTGRAQFLFGMKANHNGIGNVSPDNDNGFEADSDDNRNNATPRSHPVIYNATIMANGKTAGTADNSALAAINAKDLVEGEIYNSVFAGFRNGLNMVTSLGSGRSYAAGGESWHNWTSIVASPVLASASAGNGTQSLKIKCNTFVGVANPLTTDASSSAPGTAITTGAQYDQFTVDDKNLIVTSLAGFDYSFEINGTTNALTTKNDAVPSPSTNVALGTGCTQPPMNGFFEPANYRGAFKPNTTDDNWLSDWSYSMVLGSTLGAAACPTDFTGDGITNTADFLIFLPKYGTNCN